jgi:hypothetical protein
MNGVYSESVRSAVWRLVRHPYQNVLVRWNWKSAVMSSTVRAQLFFFANIASGAHGALRAMLTELVLRAVTAGLYGAITQGFRAATPRWAAMAVVLVVVPVLTHSLELFVHWLRGTPHLFLSVLVSAGFTVVSTAFNLFAMREGFLIVGEGQKSLGQDLKQTPRLIWRFLAALFRLPVQRARTGFDQLAERFS